MNKKMVTLKELKKTVDQMLKKHPEWADLPLIYSSDDEGNSYHLVMNSAIPAQIEEPKGQYLELVGFIGEKIDEINCVCIN